MRESSKGFVLRALERQQAADEALHKAAVAISRVAMIAAKDRSAVEAVAYTTLSRVIDKMRGWTVTKEDREKITSHPKSMIRFMTEKVRGMTREVEADYDHRPKSVTKEDPRIEEMRRERAAYAALHRQDMSFPTHELPVLHQRLCKGEHIVTTRCLDEFERYDVGDEVNTKLGVLTVTSIKSCKELSEHPYLDDLTEKERNLLSVGPFDVITLERAGP